MPTLYDAVADTPAREIGKWENGDELDAARKADTANWQEWKDSFRPLILMEVGCALKAAMLLPDHAQYDGFLRKDDCEEKWTFDHGGKLNTRRDITGMVAQIKVVGGKGQGFKWLGVFHDLECITLNSSMIPPGKTELAVTLKLLTSIVSSARHYTACQTKTEVAFEEELLGRVQEGCAHDRALPTFPLKNNNLNSDQADAVRCWVGTADVPPPRFMLLQGPPGTGKTTTAVEILRECLHEAIPKVRHGKGRLKQKYICAGPSWTSIYEYLGRFIREYGDFCADHGLRIAMSGCNDESRTAAVEPEAVESVSVVALIRSIDTWVASIDLPQKGYYAIMHSIQQRAPSFYEKLTRNKTSSPSMRAKAETLRNCKNDLRVALIKEANIVFSTLNALASSYISKALDEASIGMLIVDEAGQAPDPDLFIGCNLNPDRLLLIGDHRQLAPFAQSRGAARRGFHISSLERLYSREKGEGWFKRMLTLQYRMPPSVLEWPNQEFYGGELKCAQEVLDKFPMSSSEQYHVYDVASGEQIKVDTTYHNPSEAACIIHRIREIVKNDPWGSVLVITPYSAQRRLVQKYVKVYLPDTYVRVSTIDGCQGAECEHVILSLVRTDEPRPHGCFATEPKHLCVGLTRARESMTVICNVEKMKLKDPLRMHSLLTDAEDRDRIVALPEPIVVSGKVIGKKFIAFDDSVQPTELSNLGWKVLHGDEVTMSYMRVSISEGDQPLVVGVTVDVKSSLWSKVIPCQLVNDRNLCFKVEHSERHVLLDTLRDIANKADKSSCNCPDIVVCDRQPTDDNYFTITMGDVLIAEDIMNGKVPVLIRSEQDDGTSVMKKMKPCVARERYYHKYIPLDNQLPMIQVPVTAQDAPNHRKTYMIRLQEEGEDSWKGFVVGEFEQRSVRTMQGLLREPEELVQLVLTGGSLKHANDEGRDPTVEQLRSLVRYHLKDGDALFWELDGVAEALEREFRVDLSGRPLSDLIKDSTCTGGLLELAETTVTKTVLDEALASFSRADLPKQDYEDAVILMCVYEGWCSTFSNPVMQVHEVVEALQRVVPYLPSFAGRRCTPPAKSPLRRRASSDCVFTIDAKGTEVFDDALSCTRGAGGGWVVRLYIANPKPSLDRVGEDGDELMADLRRRAADIHLLGYTQRLMPQWVLDEASLREGDGLKSVLAVTYTVAADGSVVMSMCEDEVEVDMNLEADDDTTWGQLLDGRTGAASVSEGLSLLQQVGHAMMGHERYFEEATQIRLYRGPMHVLQYLVVRAKRHAADTLSQRDGPRLYRNFVGACRDNARKVHNAFADFKRPKPVPVAAAPKKVVAKEKEKEKETPVPVVEEKEVPTAAPEAKLSKGAANRRGEACKDQGNTHFKAKEYKKAAEQYQLGLDVARRNDTRVTLLSNLSMCHLKLEAWDEAREAAEEGLSIDPEHEKCLWRAADALMELGDFDGAAVHLIELQTLEGEFHEKAGKKLKVCTDFSLLYGPASNRRQRQDRTAADFERYMEEGNAHFEADELEEAVAQYKLAVTAAGRHPKMRYDSLFNLSLAHAKADEWEEARQTVEQCRLIDDSQDGSLLVLANALMEVGDLDGSDTLLSTLERRGVRVADARGRLRRRRLEAQVREEAAVNRTEMDHSEDAEDTLTACDKHKNQGNKHFKAKEYKKAIEEYNLGLGLAGKHTSRRVTLLSNVSLMHLKLEAWDEARKTAEEGLSIDPKHEKCLWRASEALREMGDFDGAWLRYEEVMKLGGDLQRDAEGMLDRCCGVAAEKRRETQLCRELQRLRELKGGKLRGDALARSVGDMTLQPFDRKYRTGSTLSFTSPLRFFADYVVLQALLQDQATAEYSVWDCTVDQYVLEMQTQRKRDCQREYSKEEDVRNEQKNGDIMGKGIVTDISSTGVVRVYVPQTGALVSSTVERVGGGDEPVHPFRTTVSSKLVLGNMKTYMRHKASYIVPYDPPARMHAGKDDDGWKTAGRPERSHKRKSDFSHKGISRSGMKVRFAFGNDVTVERTKEEICAEVCAQMSKVEDFIQDCVFVQKDSHSEEPRWLLLPKEKLCANIKKTGQKCTVKNCGYRHYFKSDKDLVEYYHKNYQLFAEVARNVAKELQCRVAALRKNSRQD